MTFSDREIEAMQELRETLLDVSIMATDSGNRYSLDEMLARFGFTREELLAEEDAEAPPSGSESK